MPFVSENPSSTVSRPSFILKETTVPFLSPSMQVTFGPSSLATVIAFPWKRMFSLYVPGDTSTVSPFTAASMAAWIVG